MSNRYGELPSFLLLLLCTPLILIIAGIGSGCDSKPGTIRTAPPAAVSPLHFADVTQKADIAWKRTDGAYGGKLFPEAAGGGGAFLDYDNDGFLDILLVNGDWWPGHALAGTRPMLALYHNNHDGTFSDVTAKLGLNISLQGMGVAVGDYDNDGYDDVLITGVGGNRLFHNDGGKRFTDVTTRSGVGGAGWSTSAVWVDYDNDGKLDLFVCHYCKWSQSSDIYCGGQFKIYCTPEAYPGESCRLYHNEGNGKFKDVTKQAGIRSDRGKALGVCTVDFDHDGKIDLIVANDGEPNVAYRNIGKGKFTDVSVESGLALGDTGKPRNGMGIDAADYKNDGTVGVLVGNFSYQGVGLHQEIGPGLFNDVAQQAGVQQPSLPYVTFGVLFCDFDNDGWKDAVITNGHTDDMTERSLPVQHVLQPTQIFLNKQNGAFQDATALPDSGIPQAIVGRGMAWGDFDNDGKVDLLLIQNVGAPYLLHNETPGSNHWIKFVPVGEKCSKDGYGAIIRVKTGSMTQTETVHSGSSYLSASDRRPNFGLGGAKQADMVEIQWPDGQNDVWHNVPADRVLILREGKPPHAQ